MLCELCKDIFRGDLPSKRMESVKRDRNKAPPHHTTIDGFRNSIQRCFICAMIWSHVDETDRHRISLQHCRNRSDQPLTRYWFYGDPSELALHIFFCDDEMSYASSNRTFELSQIETSNHPFRNHEIGSSTSSGACLGLAYQWLKECLENHADCSRNAKTSSDRSQFVPTRLLEIEPSAHTKNMKCKVINTAETAVNEPYATLSHCWGSTSSQIKKLTVSTLETMRSSFRILELPRTFQDAVVIASKLRVRYLWIDCLCIIQDSHEDWTQEASLMGDVYSNSICNIAATWARNSYDGCFADRDSLNVLPLELTSGWTGMDNFPFRLASREIWSRQIETAILNGRGWVLQERLLAPRVLHFGSEQIFWECRSTVASETLPVPQEQMFAHKKSVPFRDQGDLVGPFDIKRFWRQTVLSYMKCDLTRPEDKLIAISGVAQLVKSINQQEYLAGLWRDELPSRLLWFVLKCKQVNGQPSTRPQPYRAPSWSWASVDAEITMHRRNDSHPLATVEEAFVQLLTDNLTGQVRAAHIRLRGLILWVALRGERIRVGSLELLATVYSDLPTKSSTIRDWHPGCIFLVAQHQPELTHGIQFEGLLLDPIKTGERKFMRCGYFRTPSTQTSEALQLFGLKLTESGEFAEFIDEDVLQTITII